MSVPKVEFAGKFMEKKHGGLSEAEIDKGLESLHEAKVNFPVTFRVRLWTRELMKTSKALKAGNFDKKTLTRYIHSIALLS